MDFVTERMRSQFDRQAALYDQRALVQKKTAGVLCAGLRGFSRKTILDAGCGTGFLSKLLLRKFRPGLLVLNDTSERMLSLCGKKMTGPGRRIFRKNDFLSLRLSDPVDLVTANMLFQWFPDIVRPLRRAFRLLKSGGTLAFSIPINGTFAELIESLKKSGRSGSGTVLRMPDSSAVKAGLIKAGFKKIRIGHRTYRETYKSVMEFLRRLKETGTSFPVRKPLSVGEMKQTVAEYSGRFADRKGNIPVTWKIMFVRCRKP